MLIFNNYDDDEELVVWFYQVLFLLFFLFNWQQEDVDTVHDKEQH
jgi:hypothetical protein